MTSQEWTTPSLSSPLVFACALFLCMACGVDESSYFSGKSLLEAPKEKGNSADGEGALNSDEFVPGLGEELVEEEVDPSSLVVDTWYRAAFDLMSARRLVNGQAPNADLGLAASKVQQRLNLVTPLDGVDVKQTYGDGVARSDGRQEILNTPGDQEIETAIGETSASGSQSYVRVTDDDGCPSVFVCIPRIEFSPKQGDAMTICFYDAAGVMPVAIPYATVPGYDFTAYQQHFGAFGPYKARRFRQLKVDCTNPAVQSDATEDFRVNFQGATLLTDNINRLFQSASSFRIDQMLSFEYTRLVNDNRAPYLDETVKLQKLSRTYIDSTQRASVKMVKSVRSSVKLGFLEGLFVNMDGLLVDLHMELCKDRLQPQGGEYCG